MTFTAGVISQSSVGQSTASLSSTAASGGSGPYTQQWYRSTASGFTPSGGNLISGATALTLADSGLVPNTTYYYKVIYTDTGHSNDVLTSNQLTVVTAVPTLSQNQFAQIPYLGMIDLRFDANTVAVEIDSTQSTALYAGAGVVIVDSAGGVPKVIGVAADTDNALGFINFDIKTRQFVAGSMAEISMAGNVMFLYATGAIARGAQVCLNVTTNGGVQAVTGSSSKAIVGWAYDKASQAGDLIRVVLTTPSFKVDA